MSRLDEIEKRLSALETGPCDGALDVQNLIESLYRDVQEVLERELGVPFTSADVERWLRKGRVAAAMEIQAARVEENSKPVSAREAFRERIRAGGLTTDE